ncbi:hypothetical protein CUMW_122530 [Citrus unshiu]|uniref:Lipoxygenase domain-containing protein n=1 Tax=Citrus unshiu TaxID=55188 RepID=A0A2H5PC08_CITUN|nr:hypothetical protein CUMW_122530 [Citrus unshiu]
MVVKDPSAPHGLRLTIEDYPFDEPWRPILKTPQDLIKIITSIVWVTSGHHATIKFGQYTFGGYFLNRPAIARRKLPSVNRGENWELFLKKTRSCTFTMFPFQDSSY